MDILFIGISTLVLGPLVSMFWIEKRPYLSNFIRGIIIFFLTFVLLMIKFQRVITVDEFKGMSPFISGICVCVIIYLDIVEFFFKEKK